MLAGGEVIASDNNSLGGTIPDGEFRLSEIVFTSGATYDQLGLALGIRLVNLNAIDLSFPASDLEVDFDDVQLSAVVVPLPAMWPALMLVVTGLLSRRRPV